MSPIKILHLVASSHGGGAVHVRDLAAGLPRDEFQVAVAMPRDGGNVTPADFQEMDVAFTTVDIASGFPWRQLGHIRRLMRDGRFHIVHVHGARAALFGRLAAATLRPRPRLVFSIHGFATPFYANPKRALYLLLERLLQRVTDLTVCVAKAEADLFLSFGLAQPDRLRIVPYGIQVNRFDEASSTPEPLPCGWSRSEGPVLLTVCRLNVPRDFDALLEALTQVIDLFPEARLFIVGDGPLRPRVEELVRTRYLAPHVCLAGMRDDIPEFMSLADVFILTSYGWEGYPISTLEAQAAGVPVVVTDAGGSGEAVLHGVTGWVVPRSDPTALAQAVLTLLGDADLRRRFGAAGKARARREFDRSTMVARLAEIYRSQA